MGDFSVPVMEWEMKYAPVGSFGDELLEMKHELALTKYVTNPTQWRLGNSPSTLDLVFTKSRKVIGNTAIGAPLGRSDRLCSFPSQVKLRRSYGRMKPECLQAAAQTMVWSEANYGGLELWDLMRDNLLTLTNSFAPLCPVRSKTTPSWWSSRMKKALIRKRVECQRLYTTSGYLRHLQYSRERKNFDCILPDTKRVFEVSRAKKAKSSPKAHYRIGWFELAEGLGSTPTMDNFAPAMVVGRGCLYRFGYMRLHSGPF
ncbi:unnamed protein product [Echinostoma caproni]|uniref:Uncharacterized protein n=1 Tax=Echinostoma caproni TaxID=27848 RepID=A0A183B406_9TREM|nr:unnamed protein product [Echinostoma caproni]